MKRAELEVLQSLQTALQAAVDAPTHDAIKALHSYSDWCGKLQEFFEKKGEVVLERFSADDVFTTKRKEHGEIILATVRTLQKAAEAAEPERKAELQQLLDKLRDMSIWTLVADYMQLRLDITEHTVHTLELAAETALDETVAALEEIRRMKIKRKMMYAQMRDDERDEAGHEKEWLADKISPLQERGLAAMKKLQAAHDTATPERKAELQRLFRELWKTGLDVPLTQEEYALLIQDLQQESILILEQLGDVVERITAENADAALAELLAVCSRKNAFESQCLYRLPTNIIDDFEDSDFSKRAIPLIQRVRNALERMNHAKSTATPKQQDALQQCIDLITTPIR